jgi:hypothetical protein
MEAGVQTQHLDVWRHDLYYSLATLPIYRARSAKVTVKSPRGD